MKSGAKKSQRSKIVKLPSPGKIPPSMRHTSRAVHHPLEPKAYYPEPIIIEIANPEPPAIPSRGVFESAIDQQFDAARNATNREDLEAHLQIIRCLMKSFVIMSSPV